MTNPNPIHLNPEPQALACATSRSSGKIARPEGRRSDKGASTFKIAVLGLSGVGAEYLAAIRAHDAFQLVAAGEPDPKVRRSAGVGDDVPLYEDLRSLIVECAGEGLDMVFVALEPFQSHEFVELAGQRGIGVFHKPPFARTVTEARELLSAFAENGAPFVVPRFWHYDAAYTPLLEAESHIGPIRAMTASVATRDTPLGWRGDSVRSGGGVLLHGAYEWLDLIVSILGVPESVHCECTGHASTGSSKTYDTEDFAHVTLRFRGDRIGSLTARRGAVASSRTISLFGPDGEMHGILAGTAGPITTAATEHNKTESVEIIIHRRSDADEQAADTLPTTSPAGASKDALSENETADATTAAINAFSAARRGELRRLPAPASDHVNTLALIEAAYLSAKTGAPESPRQFLAG